MTNAIASLVPKVKIIAIYLRVSTAKQEDEHTIEVQLAAINKFALENGYEIVKTYKDEGWSGDILARPDLDQLRMDAKKKIWEAVLIYDPDRLARRGAWQELIVEELKEAGVEVLYVTIPPPKNEEDVIMYKMRGIFTEYERMKIKERFRLGKVNRVTLGHILVSEGCYGYTYIPNSGKKGTPEYIPGHIKINEVEAVVVRMIFGWVADKSFTLREVVRQLNELGIRPRKSKRGVWNTSTLSALLRNRTYIGEGHWGASYATVPLNPLKDEKYRKIKKTSRKMRPVGEWISLAVPRIIENDDLFERAGQRLKDNFALMGRNKKNDYLIAGKIWCNCGRRRAGEGPQKGKHLYYRCTDRVYSFPLPRTCLIGGINARIADDAVWQEIKQFMTTPERLFEQSRKNMEDTKVSGASTSLVNIENIQKDLSKLADREKRYTTAYSEGVINLQQLKSYLEPLKESISLLERSLIQAEMDRKPNVPFKEPTLEEISLFAEQAKACLEGLNFEAKKAIIAKAITVIYSTQTELQVHGLLALNQIHVKSLTEHRYRRLA